MLQYASVLDYFYFKFMKTFYFHYENLEGRRFTVCGIVPDLEPNKLHLGLSFVADNDNFVKRIGREKSFERAYQETVPHKGPLKGSITLTLDSGIMDLLLRADKWDRKAFIALCSRLAYNPKKVLLKSFNLLSHGVQDKSVPV